jgi:hypothetical protein
MIAHQTFPQPSESQYNRHATDPCACPQPGTIDRSVRLVVWLRCRACRHGRFVSGAPCPQPCLWEVVIDAHVAPVLACAECCLPSWLCHCRARG